MDTLVLPDSQPLRSLSAGRFVSHGQGTHPHRRIDSHELIWVVSGTLELFEESERFSLKAGQALLLWPHRMHGGASPYTPTCSFYWVHFHLYSALGSRSVPQVATVARPDRLTELFRHFLDDQETGALSPLEGALLVQLMLLEVARPPNADRGDHQAAVLARLARQQILQNLSGPLSTAQVAAALDCHPDYLGRCFRSVYGETITEAIQRERLKHARTLLLDSNDSVEMVARASGYPGVVFFRRIFKRTTGTTPSQFRKMYARVHLNSA